MSEQLKEAATPELSTIDKLRMLLDISKKISRSLDLQEVLNLVMDTLGSLIPYDAAGIFVLQCRDKELVPEGEEPCEFKSEAVRGYDIAELSDLHLKLGEGFIGSVALSATPIISPDVRNNPIVREVDERRLQEQWRSVAVGVLFVAVLLFSGWQRVELLQHGYRVEQMQKERSDEEEINRHLRLEIETLKSPQRIEALAVGRLKLVAPETGAAIVIERVVPPDPPPASVVAKALE